MLVFLDKDAIYHSTLAVFDIFICHVQAFRDGQRISLRDIDEHHHDVTYVVTDVCTFAQIVAQFPALLNEFAELVFVC